MHREQLLSEAPTSEELLSGPPYRRKELAQKYVAAVLDAIEGDSRGPDTWEAMYLSLALGNIVMRRYVLSINATMRALTPPEERAEIHSEAAQKLSHGDLRHFLRYVAGIAALDK